jgi:hypothetical protein
LILRPGIYARQKPRLRAIWTLTLVNCSKSWLEPVQMYSFWNLKMAFRLYLQKLTYKPRCQASAHRHTAGRGLDPFTSLLEKGPLRRHICRAIMKSDRCRGETRRLLAAEGARLNTWGSTPTVKKRAPDKASDW